MPADKQLKVATHLVRLTLPIWMTRMREEGISYVDSVVGMHHVLEMDLVPAILEISSKIANPQGTTGHETLMAEALKLRSTILDPVVALQDGDLELPENVLKTLYAAYNLIDHVCGFVNAKGKPGLLAIVANQAVDALVAAGIWSMDDLIEKFESVQRED